MKIYIPLLTLIMAVSCNKPLCVLVVSGGHSYDTAEFYDLFRSLEGIRFDSVSHPDALEFLGSGKVEEYDAVVFYDYVPGMPASDSLVYIDLGKSGIPMLFLHHSICNSQQWDGFMQVAGGKYIIPDFGADSSLLSSYKHDIDLEVSVEDALHPVTNGMDGFTIHDEGYSNLVVMEGVTPLLTTDHPECHPLVGWTHRYKDSRVVYLLFGHDRQAYENPAFRELIRNSLLWLGTH